MATLLMSGNRVEAAQIVRLMERSEERCWRREHPHLHILARKRVWRGAQRNNSTSSSGFPGDQVDHDGLSSSKYCSITPPSSRWICHILTEWLYRHRRSQWSIEVQRRDELPEEAVVDVIVRPAAGVGGNNLDMGTILVVFFL